jgi:hypothetical protein
MASPHVAGAAALVKVQNPNLDDAGIKARILGSVDKKASLEGKMVSGGRLNAGKALGVVSRITAWRPASGKLLRDRTPSIQVTVEDDEAVLTESEIQLYFNEQQTWDFTYDQTSDTLTYRPGRLGFRRHTVTVMVDAGAQPAETHTWSFRVVRRR